MSATNRRRNRSPAPDVRDTADGAGGQDTVDTTGGAAGVGSPKVTDRVASSGAPNTPADRDVSDRAATGGPLAARESQSRSGSSDPHADQGLPEDADTLDALPVLAARRHPHRPAVADPDRTVDYAELDRAIGAVAAALTDAGVRPGHRVGVYTTRSCAGVITLYAVLRAGAVAAPLDVSDPPERTARLAASAGLAFVAVPAGTPATALLSHLEATSVRLVGSSGDGSVAGPPEGHPTRSGEDGAAEAGGAEGAGGDSAVRTGGPASRADTVLDLVPLPAPPPRPGAAGGYLLFTSGSTGWPKGVLLSHPNVLHFVAWAVRELGLTATDRVGAQAAFTFDLSTFDLFGSAMAGACAHLMPEVVRAFPRDAVRWLADERVTVLYAVPTLYRALLDRGGIANEPPPDLRLLAFAGEPLPPALLHRCRAVFTNATCYNLYGPTETNVCTFERFPADWSPADGVAIGRPLPGTRVALVDADGRVTPDENEGELAVAGPSVFQGYLSGGEPSDPTVRLDLGDGVPTRAYLTGDLARRGPDGRLYLRGRRDHQVKRRGHRIELPEIEAVAQEVPEVSAAAAVWCPGEDGGEIRLFVVADGTDADRVATAIRALLPRGAAPDRVEIVPELPVNQRGKIDRDVLAAGRDDGKAEHGQRRRAVRPDPADPDGPRGRPG